MTNTDSDYIRSVLDRYVEAGGDIGLRITLINGDVFCLRQLSEVEEADTVGVWSGEIVEYESSFPERARLFVPGSGVDFAGSEIDELEDAQTGELLFSRQSRRL